MTAVPVWIDTVLPQAMARFHAERPGIRLILDTATRAEGLRRLADGHSDLHCGGVDDGELLPAALRRERFVDMTAGIVAWHDHPLLERAPTDEDLARCPWIDYDAPVTLPPGDPRPSFATLLEQLHRSTHARVRTVVDAGSCGLLPMAAGPYLAWLSLTFLERLPGRFLRPVPVALGRFRYRSGFVARRSAEDLPPLRRFEAILRETALDHPGGAAPPRTFARRRHVLDTGVTFNQWQPVCAAFHLRRTDAVLRLLTPLVPQSENQQLRSGAHSRFHRTRRIPGHLCQARSSAVGRVAITAMRSFLRINGSPRNTASPTISGSAGESPCMSGHCGFGRLQPPATVWLCPARLRLPAPEHEFGRFQIAYGGLDGRIVGVRTHACQRWRIQEFDVSVDGFPEQGRQVP